MTRQIQFTARFTAYVDQEKDGRPMELVAGDMCRAIMSIIGDRDNIVYDSVESEECAEIEFDVAYIDGPKDISEETRS